MSLTKSTTSAFSGCIDVNSSVTVSAIASANFFNLFKDNQTVNLWTKNWDLWNVSVSKDPCRTTREPLLTLNLPTEMFQQEARPRPRLPFPSLLAVQA